VLLPELEALLPEDPHADNPTASEPASAQAANARRARKVLGADTGFINGGSSGKILVEPGCSADDVSLA
jgi:hypothetical protein